MGHTRLGDIPRTRKWQEVVGLIAESTVRMDAAYTIEEEGRVCVVDANNEVGRCICRIYTGYLTREFGADAFNVRPAGAPKAVAVPA